jgi:putative membrane protein
MKYHAIAIAMTLSSLLAGAAAAQDNQANRMTASADSSFITKAAQGGQAEVELGTLATQRASNDKVKEFGQKMVDDHTQAGNELKSIATSKGVNFPDGIDSKSRATKTRLSRLHGAAFDRAYMQDMVADHKEDIAEFQREADSGSDPDVKAFAAKTLPTLQQHFEMAQDALNSVKSSRQ